MMNIHCTNRCDNNTGFGECMWGVNEDLIKRAKSGKSMCEYLKSQVLELEKMFEKARSEVE